MDHFSESSERNLNRENTDELNQRANYPFRPHQTPDLPLYPSPPSARLLILPPISVFQTPSFPLENEQSPINLAPLDQTNTFLTPDNPPHYLPSLSTAFPLFVPTSTDSDLIIENTSVLPMSRIDFKEMNDCHISEKRQRSDESIVNHCLSFPSNPSKRYCFENNFAVPNKDSKSKKTNAILLPDSLYISVFSFLSIRDLNNCALTCKRFYRLMCDCPQWTNLIVRSPNVVNKAVQLIRFKKVSTLTYVLSDLSKSIQLITHKLAQQIKSLRIFFAKQTPCTVLTRQITRMNALTNLSLTGVFVNDAFLRQISLNCPQLKQLSIFNSIPRISHTRTYYIPTGDSTPPGRGVSLQPTDNGILAITANCKNIEMLLIGGNSDYTLPKITNKCLTDIESRCPRLCCVSFEHTYNVNDEVYSSLCALPNLTSLSLIHTRVTNGGSLAAIVNMKLSLVHIFSSIINITVNAMSEIALLPHIQSVCFSLENSLMDVEAIRSLIKQLKPGFISLGAFPTSLEALKYSPDVKEKGISLLYACDYPGRPSRFAWIQCLMNEGQDLFAVDGFH